MSARMSRIQPALKKEMRHVSIMEVSELVIMWIVFALLHKLFPENVPFNYTVILGGLGGAAVAILNFLLMGLELQKIVEISDSKIAERRVMANYTKRLLLQLAWVIVVIYAPCFQLIAGAAPLYFPGIGIKAMGMQRKP